MPRKWNEEIPYQVLVILTTTGRKNLMQSVIVLCLSFRGMEHRRISHQARVQNIRGLIPIRPRSTHYIIKPKSYYIKYSIFIFT